MNLRILQFTLVLVNGILTKVIAQDPCSASVYTELGDLAKRNPTYVQDSVPVCDRYIDRKWYRARFHQMPTSAPSLGMCGTTYPYWMDDSPPDSGETKTAKVCQVGFSSTCSKEHTISVKNCGNFFVYELTPLDLCSSAYCFEPGSSCVTEVPSSITVAYHSVSWTTVIVGIKTIHEPDVHFVCQFQRLADQNLYYEITWYVDNTEVFRNQTISASDAALLSGTQMLAKGKKANSMIHCVVGAKFKIGDSPCETNPSSLFFAGIKVLTPILRINRGQSAEVELQLTIPFINQNGILNLPGNTINDQTPLYIQMAVHNSSSSVCDDPNRRSCDTEIKAFKYHERDKYNTNDWKVVHKIKVQNKHDGDFRLIDKHITLRFDTGLTNGPGSKIWEYITLPDIQVYIEDSSSAWKGKNCESHTDPHMKTFDGKYYECQLDGTFILYRNQIFQQEVQEKHHMCHPAYSYPRCTCAVAVRSGKDVFIVDICNTQTVINFPSCEDKVLKVIKASDKFYKVILPTGTLVEIKFVSWPNWNDWQLNIDIFPSPSDVGNSSGLCGILDDNYRNDFTWNNPDKTVDNPDLYHYYNHPNGFSDSWRVKNGEIDLFDNNVYGSLNSITTVFDRICTCKKKANNPQDGDIVCSYGNYKNCKFAVGKRYFCILNPEGQLRRKRDLRHLQSLAASVPRSNEVQQMNRVKRQTNTDVMSNENATAICNEAFQASDSYLMCQEHVSDLANTSLFNCISDVMMTGDVNITKIHIEAALEQCSTFVVLNSTFQETEPDITYRIESLCENNCSGNGICNSGNCTCNSGYAGSDCSFDLSGPPSITHISDFGLCDRSSEACDDITLYGKYFLENMNTTCYLRRKTLAEDGTILSEQNYEASLQERTLFEGYCPLDYNTDDHWITKFSFNVSNDGSRYTDNYNVYTYQALCQELRNDTGNITFIFKDGYCYINNTCVAAGDTNKDNLCDICNTANNKYQWSFNTGHCFIDGQCFKAGAINGTNPCSVCNPSLNITAWSPNPGFCFISDICYFDGQINPNNNCDVCQSNISQNDWIFNEGYCLIDGLCVKNGDAHVSMDCKMCNTSVNKNIWQLKNGYCLIEDSCVVDGGTNSTYPCLYCNVSENQLSWSKNPAYCEINNQCISNGQKNVSNDCYYCNTSLGQSLWSFSPGHCIIDGQCYKQGENQTSNGCKLCDPIGNKNNWTITTGYCFIDNMCISNGQRNTTDSCFYCNTSIELNNWSIHSHYCLIDGFCIKEGENLTSHNCKICDPSENKTGWTLSQDYCLISDACVINGGANTTHPCEICNISVSNYMWTQDTGYCNINGLCVRDGERNVPNECYYCNTSKGRNVWSFNPDYCFIDGSCIKEGGNHTKFGCKICDPAVDTNNWILTRDYCFIADMCILNGDENITYPCEFCNVSNSKYSWSQNTDYCNIENMCIADGQKNVSNECFYCNTSQRRESWSLSEGYCLIHNVCVMDGESNNTYPCNICNTSKSVHTWSRNPGYCNINDTCIPDGQKNASNECFYCNTSLGWNIWSYNKDYYLINGQCIKDGENHTTIDCKICDPVVDKSNWSLEKGHCFIDGICVQNGEAEKDYPCKSCNSSTNITHWQYNNGYCIIADKCISNGEKNISNPCDVCDISINKHSWSQNPDFCKIGELCVTNGERNATNECFYCNTTLGRNTWSFLEDYCLINGQCIKDGENHTTIDCKICDSVVDKSNWSLEKGHCFIDGICVQNGETEKDYPCKSCNSSTNITHWQYNNGYCIIADKCISNGEKNISNPCDVCDISINKHSWSQNPDFCKIGELCVANGERNATNECFYCNTTLGRNTWSFLEDYCLINGQCIKDGENHTTIDCKICDPVVDKSNWSLEKDYCLINGQCIKDGKNHTTIDCKICDPVVDKSNWSLEKGHCFIDGICVQDGETEKDYPCKSCNSSTNITHWQYNDGYCIIADKCISNGEKNISNPCDVCDISINKHSWSQNPDFCKIGELCVANGERNATNECFYCNTTLGRITWSFLEDYCLINGQCIKDGKNHTTIDCKICDPVVDKSNWSLEKGHCFIDGICVQDGETEKDYPCKSCNSSTNITHWQYNDGYCIIADKCISNGEKNISNPCDVCDISINKHSWSQNPDFCKIGELCVANGERNATNECFYCNTTLGRNTWSFLEGYCNIDDKCLKEGENHTLYSCKICDTTQDKSSWTIAADYCLINNMCVHDGESNKTYPCEVCNISQSRYTWSPNNEYCEVDNMRIPNGQKNSSSECFYCNTSLDRSAWSLIQDCPLTTKVQTTSTAEPTTTVQTTSTTKPTTTVQTTSTTEPTTTLQATSLTEPITTIQTTSTTKPTTTTQTTSTTEPTTTIQTTGTTESTTTVRSTSTAEPTTTAQTTSTTEPTTTVQTSTTKPTTTVQTTSTTEPTTTVQTTSKAEPTTTVQTTSTTEPSTTSTTKGTSTTTTYDRMTTSSCVEMNTENITVTYYNVSWNTSIKIEGATKRTIHNPSVNLKCNFASFSNNLFYKVEWYVDKHILVKSEVLGGSSDKNAILSLYDLISMNKRSGIQVLCKVGATKDKLMAPCEMFESHPFLAGIMMNDTKLSLPRKGKAQIGFYLTVPFVTQTVILNDTVQALRPLTVHSNIIPMSENGCKGSIGVNQCSVEISAYSYDEKNRYESDEWRKVHYITVYHIDTDGYSIDATATLYLRTSENEDGFFHNVSLDNTLIEIFEVHDTWKGKSCGSKTDPHLYTFDGVAFESHIEGEFILYRNSLFNQEIQTRHEKCHTNYPFPQCTCAVSVQSGSDVFMIDICGNNNFMDFLRCQDNVIEVYKITDKLYKVLLPTGTTVVVSLVEWPVEGSWQIDIDIYPSLADVNNTAGLCGTLDGDRRNEFIHQNGSSDSSVLEYPDDFSRSWMVKSDENLLNSAPSDRPSISSNLDKICTCSPSGNQCTYQTFSQCSKATGKRYYCTQTANQIQSLRKKRDVHLNSYLPSSLHERHKRSQSIYVTTEAEAGNVCKSAFNSSEPFQICKQYVSDMTDASLLNCIMDVRLTGDENITAIHIEAALKQCVNFLDLNTTLKTEQPDVTYQLQSLCSNNCSSHGICKEGNCTCDFGFGGSDCSFNVQAPPTILSISPNGSCDMSLRTCSEVLLDGRYFLENINKTCFITIQLIHYDNTVLDTKDIEQPLDDRTLFQGACPLPDDRRTKWITKFTFNISYDGKQFTQTYSVYKYQSECQEISYDKGVEQFSLKAGYCFIDNKCVRRETSNPVNSCEVCSPSSQKFNWSLYKDCVSTTFSPTTKSPISSPAFIISVSAVSFVFVVTLIVAILVWRYRSSAGRHLNDDDSTKDLKLPNWRTYFDEGGKFNEFYIPRGRRHSGQHYTNGENNYQC